MEASSPRRGRGGELQRAKKPLAYPFRPRRPTPGFGSPKSRSLPRIWPLGRGGARGRVRGGVQVSPGSPFWGSSWGHLGLILDRFRIPFSYRFWSLALGIDALASVIHRFSKNHSFSKFRFLQLPAPRNLCSRPNGASIFERIRFWLFRVLHMRSKSKCMVLLQ